MNDSISMTLQAPPELGNTFISEPQASEAPKQSSSTEVVEARPTTPPLEALLEKDDGALGAKLENLMSVAADHIAYVDFFLGSFEGDRKTWEQKRWRLLCITKHLLAGTGEIIVKVRSQHLHAQFERTSRLLVRCIHQLLVELGPGNVQSEIGPLLAELSVKPWNDEARFVDAMISRRLPVWPIEFLTLARIPLELETAGADLNSAEAIRLFESLSKLVRQIQREYSTKICRTFVRVRVEALKRAGYQQGALLLLLSSFFFDTGKNSMDLNAHFRHGRCSSALFKSQCPPALLFQLIITSSTPATCLNFLSSLGIEPVKLILCTSLHNSAAYPTTQIEFNLHTVQYISRARCDVDNSVLSGLIQPLVQQIMSHDKKAQIFEIEYLRRLHRLCLADIKLLSALITSVFYHLDHDGALVLNDSLDHLFATQSACRLLAECLNKVSRRDWHLTLIRLSAKLLKNSPQVQLLCRIYLLARLDHQRLHRTAPKHLYKLIMTNDHWSLDHFRTKVDSWAKRNRGLFATSRLYCHSQDPLGDCGLYAECNALSLTDAIQRLPDYPAELRVTFGPDFDLFAVFKSVMINVTSRICLNNARRQFSRDLVELLSPRAMMDTRQVPIQVQSKLASMVAQFVAEFEHEETVKRKCNGDFKTENGIYHKHNFVPN